MWIWVFFFSLFLIILLFDQTITVLYNHFGQSNSQSEADNKTRGGKTALDKWYYSLIEQNSHLLQGLSYQKPLPVPEIDVKHLTKEKFINLTENFTGPLVVRGFLKNSRACRRWNLDYLSQKYGKAKLPIIENGDIKEHPKYVKSHQANYLSMSLEALIKKVKKGEKSYLNNVSRIFGLYPELLDDMELEKIDKYTGINVKDGSNVTHMFIGGKGTGSSLHSSITGNFFYNVKGEKRWILIHPKFSAYLLPNISRTGLFVVSHFDVLNAKQGNRVLNLPRYNFTLKEGDLFFNPPWWWHAVKNETNYTIGCANRFTDFNVGLSNNLLYSLIFFSHPWINWNDFNFSTKQQNNLKFDQALLQDILRKKHKVI